MIFLTRMDKQVMYLNPDHIVSIEETPDTVITLFNGHHFIVKESAAVIIGRIVAFRAGILRRAGNAVGKKYLMKVKNGLFRSASLKRNLVGDNREEQGRSPFHSQEF